MNIQLSHDPESSTPIEASREADYPAEPDLNATDLLKRRVAQTPQRVIFSVPDTDSSSGWRDITASEFDAEVTEIAKGFIAAGVTPGDRIAFMGLTSYEWTLIDFALMTAGAVMVPVYETSSPKQLQWMLSDSGAVGFISHLTEHRDRYEQIDEQERPALAWRWCIEDGDVTTLREQGREVSDEAVEAARTAAKAADIATIIYTSGTTGSPRGAIITHSNLIELGKNILGPLDDIVSTPGASTLLFVTLAHVFARFISIFCVASGIRVGHQPNTKLLVESLGSFKPTFILAVPRVFEKVYNSALEKATAGGKKPIFIRAVRVGVAYSRALDAGRVPFLLRLQYRLYDRLVYSKLRATLGGKVAHAVSGSAPLGEFLSHFYRALGVIILEGYGLTETTAPVSVNLPENFQIGTVGPPLPGCAVRIADDGELLTKGVNVFREYWNNEEATREAFTEDGWFRTGDLASLNEDGYITITGRKKDLIVTAGGKNVAPSKLEDILRADPIIGECVVVGDGKPFIGAVMTLDSETLPGWLESKGLSADMPLSEAAKNEAVMHHVQAAVNRANNTVSRAESIRKFTILDYEFTLEDGTLTPKLSIKRHVVMERIRDEVEELYRNTGEVKAL